MSAPGGVCEGFAVVDKAAGCTSHDVVAQARRLLGTRRIGHSGTLDPAATGVLVLGVGRATRLLRYVTDLGKVYEATVRFGAETDSGDADGTITTTYDMAGLTVADAIGATGAFVGEIQQIPPMVSALKVDGKRLHALAREGRTVPREPRTVHVQRFVVTGFDPGPLPTATVEVACSTGTYIRTLAADWGRALGGGAHLTALRRVAVGSFTADEARPVEHLERAALLAPAAGLRDYPSLTVDAAAATDVSHGRPLPLSATEAATAGEGGGVGAAAGAATADGGQGVGAAASVASAEGPWAVLDAAGALLAVYERRGDALRPAVVLAAAG